MDAQKYLVANLRKADGAVFYPDSRNQYFDTFEGAEKEATRKAQTCSDAYTYIVCMIVPMQSYELDYPPVKVTRL